MMSPQIPLLPIEDGAPGAALDLSRLLSTRLLIQAASGGGKSRALRYILEQTHGHVQQIVLDPEGEFASLREKFDFILAGAEGDVPAEPASAALLCRRLVDLGASAVIDLYSLSPADRRKFVRLFLEQLMSLPREMWRPLLVVIDEGHTFCPERGSGEAESTDAVIQLCSQGRKRGYSCILATQRLAKVHKDAASELLNKMIGRTGGDVDVRRAGDELGMDTRGRGALKKLTPGQFYITGPAFVDTDGAMLSDVMTVRTGDVLTSHPDAGGVGGYTPPPAPAAIAALLAQLADLPAQAQEEAATVQQLREQIAQLRSRPAGETKVVEKPIEKIVEKRVEVPVVSEEQEARLRESAIALAAQAESLTRQVASLQEALGRLRSAAPPPVTYSEHVPNGDLIRETPPQNPGAALPFAKIASPSVEIAPAQQKIMDTLASFEALGVTSVDRANAAVFSGISSKSSAYSAHVSSLLKAGLISYPSGGSLSLTSKGRAAARPQKTPATRQQLHQAWRAKLKPAQGRILTALIDVYPKGLTREGLAARSGQSLTSSAFSANISELQKLDLVIYPQAGAVCASGLLFPKGLS